MVFKRNDVEKYNYFIKNDTFSNIHMSTEYVISGVVPDYVVNNVILHILKNEGNEILRMN